jgi:hypothetical protein
MKADTYEKHAQTLRQAIDSQVEYEERHVDAGDAYMHMLDRSGWDYGNCEEKIREYIAEHNLPEVDMESLREEVLGYYLAEARPGCMYGMYGKEQGVKLAAWPVGEVEVQFCTPDLARLLDCTEEEAVEFWQKAKHERQFCISGDCAYESTDAVWFAFLPHETLVETIQEINEKEAK